MLCSRRESYPVIAKLHGGTGLQRIVGLVSSNNETLGIHAAVAVAHLAQSDSILTTLLRLAALPELVALLRRKTPAAQSAALSALTTMSRIEEGRTAVGSAGGCVRRTLRLAQSADGEVSAQAVRLLLELVRDEAVCRGVAAQGGVDAMRALVRVGGPDGADVEDETRQSAQTVLRRLEQVAQARTGELVLEVVTRLRRHVTARTADRLGLKQVLGPRRSSFIADACFRI